MKNLPIGEIMKQAGYITDQQLQQALAYQKVNRGKRIGDILIELGFLTERQKLEALAQRLQMEIMDISHMKMDIDAVEKIPKQLAVKYNVVCVSFQNGRATIAINDPLDFYAIEDVRLTTNVPQTLVLAEKSAIVSAIEYGYAEIDARTAAAKANLSADANPVGVLDETINSTNEAAPVVQLLNTLLVRGYSINASDIHIEPFEEKTVIRMRIDGMIVEYLTLSASLHQALIARTKILSNMDIAEKRLPQDGHFQVTLENINMNIRVSVIPTVYGEKAVLRFLSSNTVIDHAGQFGMDESNYKKLVGMLQNPHGIVYLTGPTGSGKTTTLYMVLEYLAKKQVNICTIEDPVERNLARISQMQVNNTAGLTFEAGLRALLRQDPDIMMVGETRDAQTASISVRAAITGHLVLSTLHTNDAISAIVRLTDMGVPPYLIANSVVGLVAQRLVKKVCANCAYEYEPDEEERRLVGENVKTLRKGKGCHLCNQTGYKGRLAIHEVVAIDRTMRNMIAKNAEIDDLYAYSVNEQGLVTLRDSMVGLVRAGISTIEELQKLTYTID